MQQSATDTLGHINRTRRRLFMNRNVCMAAFFVSIINLDFHQWS